MRERRNILSRERVNDSGIETLTFAVSEAAKTLAGASVNASAGNARSFENFFIFMYDLCYVSFDYNAYFYFVNINKYRNKDRDGCNN